MSSIGSIGNGGIPPNSTPPPPPSRDGYGDGKRKAEARQDTVDTRAPQSGVVFSASSELTAARELTEMQQTLDIAEIANLISLNPVILNYAMLFSEEVQRELRRRGLIEGK